MNDDWADSAACKGKPTEWWMPDHDEQMFYAWAKPICDRCPVKAECLEDARTWESGHHVYGMRGGQTPGERKGDSVRLLDRSKPCERCGTEFIYRTTTAKFCSDGCKQRHRYDPVCEECGQQFMPTRKGHKRFCSSDCRNRAGGRRTMRRYRQTEAGREANRRAAQLQRQRVAS